MPNRKKLMIDLPPNLPESYPVQESVLDKCIVVAAKHFNINPLVIKAIARVEGGGIGTMSKNTNNTYDMGVMQINTIHLPAIKKAYPAITWEDIAFKPCVNVGIGAWILRQRLDETDDFWKGVAHYHSKTPKHRDRYLRLVRTQYSRLLKHYIKKLSSQGGQ